MDGIDLILKRLEQRDSKYYLILETGSKYTLKFEDFVKKKNGEVLVIEKNIDIVKGLRAKDKDKPNTLTVINGDSVNWLWNLHPIWKGRESLSNVPLSLLFLNSMIVDFNRPLAASSHHMQELAAISRDLKPGTLVAVDDANITADDERIPENLKGGKIHEIASNNFFIDAFMAKIDARVLYSGKQKVWEIT